MTPLNSIIGNSVIVQTRFLEVHGTMQRLIKNFRRSPEKNDSDDDKLDLNPHDVLRKNKETLTLMKSIQ